VIHVKTYIVVFGALLALTVITVAASYLSLPARPTIALALIVATAKAGLVAMFFMHLKGEQPMVVWPLAFTMFCVAALLVLILWAEADHIVGPQLGA
jgi:cytochrome c oxidase subunit IV